MRRDNDAQLDPCYDFIRDPLCSCTCSAHCSSANTHKTTLFIVRKTMFFQDAWKLHRPTRIEYRFPIYFTFFGSYRIAVAKCYMRQMILRKHQPKEEKSTQEHILFAHTTLRDSYGIATNKSRWNGKLYSDSLWKIAHKMTTWVCLWRRTIDNIQSGKNNETITWMCCGEDNLSDI